MAYYEVLCRPVYGMGERIFHLCRFGFRVKKMSFSVLVVPYGIHITTTLGYWRAMYTLFMGPSTILEPPHLYT